jgi:hypothetical protein
VLATGKADDRETVLKLFDLAVVSDPGAALAYNERMWQADLAAQTQYDIDLLKPGLLFADRVTLHSFREDMLALVERDIVKVSGMPMKMVMAYRDLSLRRDPSELALLDLSESDLMCAADAERLRDIFRAEKLDLTEVDALISRYDERMMKCLSAIRRILLRRRRILRSPELERAVESGIVTVFGWSAEPADPYSLALRREEEFLVEIEHQIVDRLTRSEQAVMFEPGANLMLVSRPGTQEKPARVTTGPSAIASPATVAASLLEYLPGLKSLPVAEVLDLRGDLAEYLPPFRAAVIDLAEQIERSHDMNAASDLLERHFHKEIYPAMIEIRRRVTAGRYSRHLLDAFATDAATKGAAFSAVAFATGSVLSGIGLMLPAGAATLAVPAIRALNSTLKNRDEVRQHRLFFLYEARRRLTEA